MAINWYPGHMHKAQKEIKEALPQIDLIIEVMDARIPYSSENPMIQEIRGEKPVIKVLTKSDLADPELTQQWLTYLEQEQGVKALALTTEQPQLAKKIPELCRKLVPNRVSEGKQLRAMIMGIPNVGKSTLINTLTGKIIAKVGNEPAVTKSQQRIRLDDDIYLSDTPGMLWPKIHNEDSGYRLAVSGAVKDTAFEHEEIAFYAAEFLLEHYPERLRTRYELPELPTTEVEFMEALAKKRGCLRPGGRFDFHKASEILLNELRGGMLGRITLETPTMVEKEKQIVAELVAAKEAEKAEKLAGKKKTRRRR